MGFRLHRSVQLFPGLRLNFSKSGVGFSTGVKGYHVAHMANGRNRRTISIPGTGMSWVTESVRARSTGGAKGTVATIPATPERPGLFAPREEKDLYAALRDHDAAKMLTIAQGQSSVALAAGTLAALILLQGDKDDDALGVLQKVFDSGVDPGTDAFLEKYAHIAITVEVVEGASGALPVDRTTVGLLLAELYQRRNDAARAITIVEGLEPSTTTALSLAELYAATGHFDEVITITEGAPNTDDATSMLWIFRGIAFREQKLYPAARECFAKVIRCRSRNPIVLHRARFERARCYAAEGKTAPARKDLATIRAEDADYDGLDAAIAELDKSD